MKKILFLVLICISTNLFSQDLPVRNEILRRSISVGFLQGGGSLVGADLELLVNNNVGVQFGAGFVGFGAGINYHFKPSIRSSFVSFQYWNQGIGNGFVQSMIGPSFVYRGKKWFTFQIGAAALVDEGPAMPADYTAPPVMLVYSIGAYFPL